MAAFTWDSFFKFLPDILNAAAKPLGLLALAIIAAAIVLVFLGKGLPAPARLAILVLVLLGLGGLTWRVGSLSQTLPAERGTIEPAPEETTIHEAESPAPLATTTFLKLPTGLAKHHLIGTDVSHFDSVDWSSVGETPITFVFIRASQGSTILDPKLAANWRSAGDAHLLRGAYHFFTADEDGEAQAKNFLNALAQAGATSAELPAVLDLEEVPRITRAPVDNFTFVKRIQAWLNAVETATNRKPVIYTNKAFWNSHGSADFGDYPLWLARYLKSLPTVQDLPLGWKRWTFWQFADRVHFGSFGVVDGNIFDSLGIFDTPVPLPAATSFVYLTTDTDGKGPAATIREAAVIKAKFAAHNLDLQVRVYARDDGSRYAVGVGDPLSDDKAQNLVNRLKKLGFSDAARNPTYGWKVIQ